MRYPLWCRVLLAAALVCAVPAPGQAQFGALKKKLKEKVEPTAETTSNKSAPRSKSPVYGIATITPGVVDQLIAGLRAEAAERDRLRTSASTDPALKARFAW